MTRRFRATHLEDVLESQGRSKAWLGRQIGVHRSMVVHIAKGRRPVDERTGERVASLLGVPFFVLFELSDGGELVSHETATAEAIPA